MDRYAAKNTVDDVIPCRCSPTTFVPGVRISTCGRLKRCRHRCLEHFDELQRNNADLHVTPQHGGTEAYTREKSIPLIHIPVSPNLAFANIEPSQRSLSPPSGSARRHPNGSPTSPPSYYADDLPSTFQGSPPYAGDAAGERSPYSPPSALSIWIDNPSEQQHLNQHQQTAGMHSVSASLARRLQGDDDRNHGSAFSGHEDDNTAVGSSHGGADKLSLKNGPLSSENRSVSPPPPPPPGRGMPSSIVRRISDKGGGSLPCSPTRGGGGRYGNTGQLVG